MLGKKLSSCITSLHKTYLPLCIISCARRTTICFCVHLCMPNNTQRSSFILPSAPSRSKEIVELAKHFASGVIVFSGAMKSICSVLYRICAAIKSTFHQAMKRNGRIVRLRRHIIHCVYAFPFPKAVGDGILVELIIVPHLRISERFTNRFSAND